MRAGGGNKMLNQSIIQGRLTADPELKKVGQDNTPFITFTVAVERDYKNKDGERDADFIHCVAWRGTAEFLNNYFKKGAELIVTGPHRTSSYTDKEGVKRTSNQIVADTIHFCGPPKNETDQPQPQGQSSYAPQPQQQHRQATQQNNYYQNPPVNYYPPVPPPPTYQPYQPQNNFEYIPDDSDFPF